MSESEAPVTVEQSDSQATAVVNHGAYLSKRVYGFVAAIMALVVILIVLVTTMFVTMVNDGNAVAAYAEPRYVFAIDDDNALSGFPEDATVYLMLDKETQYLYLCINSASGIALTPLLDEHGNPTSINDDLSEIDVVIPEELKSLSDTSEE